MFIADSIKHIPKPEDVEIGRVFKTLRETRGVTQLYVASCCEVTEGTVSKIEHGTEALTVKRAIQFCKCLNISAVQLIILIELKQNPDTQLHPISKTLLEYFLSIQKNGIDIGTKKEEIKELIKKIESYYNNT